LINGAYLILNNSNVYGTLVATQGGGQITVPAESNASNHGWWGIASQTHSEIVLKADGTFSNYGAIEVGKNGTFTLSTANDVSNYGYIQTDPGSRMYVFSGGQMPPTYTTLTNAGKITVNGGLVDMGADVQQVSRGKTTITNNGTLQLDGKFDGGTIDIHKGMLTFQQTPAFQSPGPLAASELTADIEFTGKTGEIDLGRAVIAAYRPETNDILVTAPWEGGQVPAADFKLTGHYSAHDFTFGDNGQIYYHHHG
jgi:hypothetical protein